MKTTPIIISLFKKFKTAHLAMMLLGVMCFFVSTLKDKPETPEHQVKVIKADSVDQHPVRLVNQTTGSSLVMGYGF